MLHFFVRQKKRKVRAQRRRCQVSEAWVRKITTPEFMMGNKYHVSSSSELWEWMRAGSLQSSNHQCGFSKKGSFPLSNTNISTFRNEQHPVFEPWITPRGWNEGIYSANNVAFVKTTLMAVCETVTHVIKEVPYMQTNVWEQNEPSLSCSPREAFMHVWSSR